MSKVLAQLWVVLVISSSAHAFQLSDHRKVTMQAYTEFMHCFPRFADELDASFLLRGDEDEDLDLIEKLLFYSHYYSPGKHLHMVRGTSFDRIENLSAELNSCRVPSAQTVANTALLGHAIHHFQDMTVPAHVVPITHSFWDGFEGYTFSGDIASGWDCEQIAAVGFVGGLEEILTDTAEQTLKAIADYRVNAIDLQSHTSATLTGKDFWAAALGDGFGAYGAVGNHFGEIQVTLANKPLLADERDYELFKQRQMRLAVQATLRGLAWMLRPDVQLTRSH